MAPGRGPRRRREPPSVTWRCVRRPRGLSGRRSSRQRQTREVAGEDDDRHRDRWKPFVRQPGRPRVEGPVRVRQQRLDAPISGTREARSRAGRAGLGLQKRAREGRRGHPQPDRVGIRGSLEVEQSVVQRLADGAPSPEHRGPALDRQRSQGGPGSCGDAPRAAGRPATPRHRGRPATRRRRRSGAALRRARRRVAHRGGGPGTRRPGAGHCSSVRPARRRAAGHGRSFERKRASTRRLPRSRSIRAPGQGPRRAAEAAAGRGRMQRRIRRGSRSAPRDAPAPASSRPARGERHELRPQVRIGVGEPIREVAER